MSEENEEYYCVNMGEDKKCNSILAWAMIECLYCHEEQPLREYHITYRCPIREIKQEGRFELHCPNCANIMILESFNLKRLDILRGMKNEEPNKI